MINGSARLRSLTPDKIGYTIVEKERDKMSNLKDTEKLYLEKILKSDSGPGYILDYNDSTFGELFARYNIAIHSEKYHIKSPSKANKLRAFWTQESEVLVGKILSEMLDFYETNCIIKNKEIDAPTLKKSREIVARLLGKSIPKDVPEPDDNFLKHEFSFPNIQKLPIDSPVVPIIEYRLKEARIALKHGAYLSVIFLCGSVLEAVLQGAAQKDPKRFNEASASPKDKNNKVKPFYDWKLAESIDVAYEIGLIKLDVKKHSHDLRDFRNYIHPHLQILSGFTPDDHTAKICFHVLKAALASVAGER